MGHGDALRGGEGVRVSASGLQRGQAAWGLEGLNGINWSGWGRGGGEHLRGSFLLRELDPPRVDERVWCKICLEQKTQVNEWSVYILVNVADAVVILVKIRVGSQPSPKEADDLGLQRERAPPCSEQMFSLPRPPSVFGMKDSWSLFSE